MIGFLVHPWLECPSGQIRRQVLSIWLKHHPLVSPSTSGDRISFPWDEDGFRFKLDVLLGLVMILLIFLQLLTVRVALFQCFQIPLHHSTRYPVRFL